ncbi:MAG TPA: hypothetical protein VKP64_15655, partial [Mycobacteriales bacterium]|nr:hypothetical protein [Mycobacteriales bacterium]
MFEARWAAVARLSALLPPRCASLVLGRAVELPPGPQALRLLAAVDPDSLEEGDRVELLLAWE